MKFTRVRLQTYAGRFADFLDVHEIDTTDAFKECMGNSYPWESGLKLGVDTVDFTHELSNTYGPVLCMTSNVRARDEVNSVIILTLAEHLAKYSFLFKCLVPVEGYERYRQNAYGNWTWFRETDGIDFSKIREDLRRI